RVHGLFDIGDDGRSLLGREARTGPDAAPVLHHEVNAAFLEGWGVDDADAFGSRNAEDAQRTGFDLGLELAIAGDADRDLAAEHGGERFTTAREGDVVDGLGVDPGGLGKEPRGDVVGATGRTAGPAD